MNLLKKRLGIILLCSAIGPAWGQTQNSTIDWSYSMPALSLGSGLKVTPTEISVMQPAITPTGYKWQNKGVSFSLLDFAEVSSSLSKLDINAWAEWKFVSSRGQASFDTHFLTNRNANHRSWRVAIRRDWTAFVPSQKLLKKPIAAAARSLAEFERIYGNRVVKAVTYSRSINVDFDSDNSETTTESEMHAVIAASFGSLKAGGSVDSTLSTYLANHSVTIRVTTLTGYDPDDLTSDIISQAAAGDLDKLRKAIATAVDSWKSTPADPNAAGYISKVFTTGYANTIPSVGINAQEGPNQLQLREAMKSYFQLAGYKQRFNDLALDASQLNPTLRRYLFGLDKKGVHYPGKVDALNQAIDLQTSYLDDLLAGKKATDPQVTFSFDDPDRVQWRILSARWDTNFDPNGGPPNAAGPAHILVEIYSNAYVSPTCLGATIGPSQYYRSVITATHGGKIGIDPYGAAISELDSYSATIDPKTGIAHRFVMVNPTSPLFPNEFRLGLRTKGGNPFIDAIDWNFAACPTFTLRDSHFTPK